MCKSLEPPQPLKPAESEPEGDGSGYRVFTRAFDEEITAQTLSEQIEQEDGESNRIQKVAWNHFNKKYGDLRAKLSSQTDELNSRLKESLAEAPFDRLAITLLIDHSGSMKYDPVTYAALITQTLAAQFSSLGIAIEVLGHTTRTWRGGRAREDWIAQGKPRNPGRLCDLRHIVYRSFTDRHDGPVAQSLDLSCFFNPRILRENVDGEALLWAASRMSGCKSHARAIIHIGDEGPVDDSTLSANRIDYLLRHLFWVRKDLRKNQGILVANIKLFKGDMNDLSNLHIGSLNEIGEKLLVFSGALLTELCSRVALAGSPSGQ